VKARKKKRLSPKKRLLGIFTRQLAKMPADEAEKRIEKLKELVSDDDASDRAKPQGPNYSRPTPYTARSH
jgi:hypothetical protein